MAGSLIKINESIVSSAVPSVTLTGIDSTYDVYMVSHNNVLLSAASYLYLRLTESGTPNTTANYDVAYKQLKAQTTFANDSATNWTYFISSTTMSTTAGTSNNANHYIFNANNSSEYTFLTFEYSMISAAGNLQGAQGGGVFTVTSAVDGIQFYASSGNIVSGTFTLYSLKK